MLFKADTRGCKHLHGVIKKNEWDCVQRASSYMKKSTIRACSWKQTSKKEPKTEYISTMTEYFQRLDFFLFECRPRDCSDPAFSNIKSFIKKKLFAIATI